MFWRRRSRERTEPVPAFPEAPPRTDPEETPEERVDEPHAAVGEAEAPPARTEEIELERDAPRPVAIQHAAEELSRRGDRVVELFKGIESPRGRANLAIHLLRGADPEESVFVEVATGPWDEDAIRNAARTASILRGSDHADATLEFLSAYPIPDEVRFFQESTAAALFQLDLFQGDDLAEPEGCAETFKETANRHWGLDLRYETEELPLIEELLTAALNEGQEDSKPPVLRPLVHGLGCYVGEVLRRNSQQPGSWYGAEEWGEEIVLEFPDLVADPIGQARAFLENGPEDSLAFYAEYVLRELGGSAR